jgi:predicted phage terminase large subunit-like protein
VATVGFTLWNVVNNPNIRVLISSENFSNSAKYLQEIKNHIEQNKLFQALFGNLKPSNIGFWRKEDITVASRTNVGTKEPTITASGVGQTKVGMHYDLVILDDIVSNNNINTADQIQKTLDYYRLILSLPDPGATLIVIGTRYHFQDLYGHILEEEKDYYDIIIRKAIRKDGTLYFPTRLTQEFLDEQKRAQGSAHFSNQYQNEPIDSESAIFRQAWLNYYETPPANLRHFILTDAAASLKQSADYSVVMVVGVDEHSNIFIIDPWRDRVTLNDFINKIFESTARYKVHEQGVVTIEVNAFQQAIKYMMSEEMNRRGFYFPIKELSPNTNISKDRRIKALQPYFENGKIYLKKEHIDLIDEIIRYPKTRHDDMVDALCSIVQVIFPADTPETDPYEGKTWSHNEKTVKEEIKKLPRKVKRRKYGL